MSEITAKQKFTQDTLKRLTGKNFFSFWRQSHDKRQSIFCVSNVTNVYQYLDLSELNLIASNEWWDLISNEIIIDIKSTITLKAYQTMWITNY